MPQTHTASRTPRTPETATRRHLIPDTRRRPPGTRRRPPSHRRSGAAPGGTVAALATRRRPATEAISHGLNPVPVPVLVLGGLLGLQGGTALTTSLYPLVGPAGVVALRLVLAAVSSSQRICRMAGASRSP